MHRGELLTWLFLVVVDNKYDLGRLQNNHVVTATAVLAPAAPPPVLTDAAATAVLAPAALPPVLADAAAAALLAVAAPPPVLADAAAAAVLAVVALPPVLAETAAAAPLALCAPQPVLANGFATAVLALATLTPVRTRHAPIRPRVSSRRRRLRRASAPNFPTRRAGALVAAHRALRGAPVGRGAEAETSYTGMRLMSRLFFTALATVASLQQLTPRCDRRSALLGVGAAALAAAPGSRALAASGSIPTWQLAGGVAFPTLALNTAGMSIDGAELAFRNAIAAGKSHVEFHPGIERDGVARVLPSIARKSVFLSTKVETGWERRPSPSAAAASVRKRLDADLTALGVPYVDMLMLRESPDCAVMQAMWAEMEKAKAEGRARSLGVVNYCDTTRT